MGEKPCDMAGKSGDQNCRAPPIGDSDGRVIRQRRGKPPAWRRIAPPAPAPPGFSPGDARGEAPCIRKLEHVDTKVKI